MITFQRHLGISRNFKQLRSIANTSILSSKKDESNEKDEKKLSKEDIANKLNDLLKVMTQKEDNKPKKDVQLAQAVKRKREKPQQEKPLGEKLAGAAKEVASSIGGDVEKTELELLNILMRQSDSSPQMLKDVLKGIAVEKAVTESRAQQVRDSLSSHPSVSSNKQDMMRKIKKKTGAHVDLLGSAASSYLTGLQPRQETCELPTWQLCVERDMRLSVTHPPANIYEQMIIWTDRGMFWNFPIDNEQGLDEEKKVSFEDHVFLETHLEGWCPEKGPVRHFMELVCVGLSKNYWLTVEEKKNHIMWYKEYFTDKKDLLKEIGAGTITVETKDQKQLSS